MADTLNVACAHCGTMNRIPAGRLAERPRCGRCHEAIFTGRPIDVAEADFERKVLKTDLPVLVDFWAPWCGPCRMMAPAFEQAADTLEPGVRLAKVNTDEAQGIAGRYAIRSIPTLMLFRGGEGIARHAGAMTGAQLERWVRQHLPA